MLKSLDLANLYLYQKLFINKLNVNELFVNNPNNIKLYTNKAK